MLPIVMASITPNPAKTGFVLTWNSAQNATYSILKTNVFSASANWPVLVTNYPPGGAAGGSPSYMDTATANLSFYRAKSP